MVLASLNPPQVLADFRSDRLTSFRGDGAVMERLRDLLECQSDQYADDNDANLACKCTPTLQWLGQMEMD